MPNPFDQFDAAPAVKPTAPAVNPFDQFDSEAPSTFDTAMQVVGQNPDIAKGEAGMSALTGMLATPIAGLAGLGQAAKNLVSPGMQATDRVAQVQNALTYQPRSQGGQEVSRAANMPAEGLAKVADVAGDTVRTTPAVNVFAPAEGLADIGSGKRVDRPGAATVTNTAIQMLPSLLLRGRAPEASAIERPKPIPTKAELAKAASDAYKTADEAGIVVKPESFDAVKTKIVQMATKEGIDPALHPDATAALKRIAEADGEMSLQKLETLRKIASDAEGSIKPADRRLAGKMVDELDDYIDSLAQKDVVAGDPAKAKALAEARDLYSRKKKTDVIDQLVNRAELSAPNFSASGMENALRTEFRSLAKNERRMRTFTPEEQAAIRKVATGGAGENALRLVGKLAPTGTLSTAISTGLGFAVGGPAGAVAAPTLGAAARFGATRATMANVRAAQELMRRGRVAPQATPPASLPPNALVLPAADQRRQAIADVFQ